MAKVSRAREVAQAVEAVSDGIVAEQLTLASIDELLNQATPQAAEARRGRGRPKGARNRRTAEMLEFLERVGYEPPMLKLARIAAADTRTMATALGCRRLEAFDRQQRALEALLPYWHQKLPQALEVDSRGVTALFLGVPPAAGGGEPGEMLSGTHIARMIGLAEPAGGELEGAIEAAAEPDGGELEPDPESEGNQGLSETAPGSVEREASNADG